MNSRGEGRAVALSMVLRSHNPAWQLQRVSRQKREFANRPHVRRSVATRDFLKAATCPWGSKQLKVGPGRTRSAGGVLAVGHAAVARVLGVAESP